MEEQVLIVSAILITVLLAATYAYCFTLNKVLKKLPEENQSFPRWFVWLILIPWLGLVFQFIMLPFGIPNAIKKTFANNQEAIEQADILFKVGLAQVTLTFLGIIITAHPINQIIAVFGLGVWITYWVIIAKFDKRYLSENKTIKE